VIFIVIKPNLLEFFIVFLLFWIIVASRCDRSGTKLLSQMGLAHAQHTPSHGFAARYGVKPYNPIITAPCNGLHVELLVYAKASLIHWFAYHFFFCPSI
jgi:hypothetical protein